MGPCKQCGLMGCAGNCASAFMRAIQMAEAEKARNEQYRLAYESMQRLLMGSRNAKVVAQAPLAKADLAGPILAYRQWRADGERLTSVTRSDAWPWGRPFQASEKPTQHTHAGLYAAKDCARLDYQRSGPEVVTGRVALWGVVIEHEAGYRAEFAYPFELFVPPSPMPGFPGSGAARIKAIAERYGIGTREAGA